jgi:hypothetical protein
VLVGKKSTTGGVDVTRATYERNATGGAAKVQVLATSKSSQDIVVQDGDNGPGPGRLLATTPLRGDASRYMARVDVPGALPASVDVVDRGDVRRSSSARTSPSTAAARAATSTRCTGTPLPASR